MTRGPTARALPGPAGAGGGGSFPGDPLGPAWHREIWEGGGWCAHTGRKGVKEVRSSAAAVRQYTPLPTAGTPPPPHPATQAQKQTD